MALGSGYLAGLGPRPRHNLSHPNLPRLGSVIELSIRTPETKGPYGLAQVPVETRVDCRVNRIASQELCDIKRTQKFCTNPRRHGESQQAHTTAITSLEVNDADAGLNWFIGQKETQSFLLRIFMLGFPGGAVVENLPANAGDTGSSPGLGRSHMPRSN